MRMDNLDTRETWEMGKTPSEHALSIFKAGIAAIPGIGGPLASLIGDYIPVASKRATDQALEYLQQDLAVLKDRVDVARVNKEQFAELFKSAYLVIVRSHHEERLRAAAALIVNILLKEGDPEKLTYTEADHFSRCLDQLSIGALRTLAWAMELATRMKAVPAGAGSTRLAFGQLMTNDLRGDTHLLMGLLGELHALNLVHIPGAPQIRTPKYGNYDIELTPLGARFVKSLLKSHQRA